MCHVTRFILPAFVAIAVLAVANTVHAGEPFHPIYQPIIDFFGIFRLF